MLVSVPSSFMLLYVAETIETDTHSCHGCGLPAGVETSITLTVVVCSLGFITFIIRRRKMIMSCSGRDLLNIPPFIDSLARLCTFSYV